MLTIAVAYADVAASRSRGSGGTCARADGYLYPRLLSLEEYVGAAR
jgi:hypothetical protein